MSEAQAEYTTKAPGLFHAVLTEPVTIWHWCAAKCWVTTHQDFVRDEELDEVYKCQSCGLENRVRVR